jgi:hypothetical protein
MQSLPGERWIDAMYVFPTRDLWGGDREGTGDGHRRRDAAIGCDIFPTSDAAIVLSLHRSLTGPESPSPHRLSLISLYTHLSHSFPPPFLSLSFSHFVAGAHLSLLYNLPRSAPLHPLHSHVFPFVPLLPSHFISLSLSLQSYQSPVPFSSSLALTSFSYLLSLFLTLSLSISLSLSLSLARAHTHTLTRTHTPHPLSRAGAHRRRPAPARGPGDAHPRRPSRRHTRRGRPGLGPCVRMRARVFLVCVCVGVSYGRGGRGDTSSLQVSSHVVFNHTDICRSVYSYDTVHDCIIT